MVTVLIYLLCACIFFGLAYYIINNLLPEPMRKWANVIVIVIGGILLIMFLLNFAGGSTGFSLPPLRR